MSVIQKQVKKSVPILVSGATINGTAATANKTSDAFELSDNPWSLIFTFSSLTLTAAYPTLSIQGSNDIAKGANTWAEIPSGGVTLPNLVKSRYCEYRFLRIVYTANSATGGTINAYINQIENA